MAPGTVTPICACVDGGGGGTPEFQPEMIPASLAKMNVAGPLAAPFVTMKPPPVLLKTRPVGAPPGIATTNDEIVLVLALYRIDVSLPLLAIHHGDVGVETRPHGLTSKSSCRSAAITLASSEIRLCCV